MFSLSETFQSLKLEDGQPDLAARKAQLDDLKDHLSYTEVRRLRDQLNSIHMRTDIYIRLPADLLAVVVDYLELEDLLLARRVSRTWRHLFSAPELCLRIAQEQLPATWSNYLLALQSSTEGAARSMFLKYFFIAAVDRVKKRRGCYEIVSAHTYDHDDAPPPATSSNDWQYESGRIAYRIHSYGFVAENLFTGVVSRFFDENRERVLDWLLLENYIIFSKSARNTLCALPINSSISIGFHTVRLPNRVSRISGQGRQVGIATASGDIFVWRIGYILKQVDTPQICKGPTGVSILNSSIIFHPTVEEQFFVAYQSGKSECSSNGENIDSISIIVLEYADWKLCAVHQSDSVTSNYHDRRPFTISGGAIACMISKLRVKDCRLWQDGPRWSDLASANQRDGSNFHASVEQIIFATFNIWSKKFETLSFCPSPTDRNGVAVDYSRDALFWNSQLLLPIAHTESSSIQSAETPLLLAIRDLKSSGKSKQKVWYARGVPITDSIIAQGDDDTVVLLGKDTMVVWRFKQTA